MVLGDDVIYNLKGSGDTSLQLESYDALHLVDALYLLRMKMNLVSITILEDKDYKVTFYDGKVLAWNKDYSMDTTHMIGV